MASGIGINGPSLRARACSHAIRLQNQHRCDEHRFTIQFPYKFQTFVAQQVQDDVHSNHSERIASLIWQKWLRVFFVAQRSGGRILILIETAHPVFLQMEYSAG